MNKTRVSSTVLIVLFFLATFAIAFVCAKKDKKGTPKASTVTAILNSLLKKIDARDKQQESSEKKLEKLPKLSSIRYAQSHFLSDEYRRELESVHGMLSRFANSFIKDEKAKQELPTSEDVSKIYAGREKDYDHDFVDISSFVYGLQ